MSRARIHASNAARQQAYRDGLKVNCVVKGCPWPRASKDTPYCSHHQPALFDFTTQDDPNAALGLLLLAVCLS
jgi:hypothetical protein